MLKDLCFEIIQKCPNNCLFCSSCADITKENIISYQDFTKTIDYFHEKYGIKEISLSGGEPLLHPDLYKMIAYCSNKGIKKKECLKMSFKCLSIKSCKFI